MARIFLGILKCLPATWASFLAKRFSTLFHREERIVREIYASQYNKQEKVLKANFAAFRPIEATGRKELSCVRFELETIQDCRARGQAHSKNNKTAFVGYACTKVAHINLWQEYSLKFTPNMIEIPPNLFHVDVYDNSPTTIEKGEANTSAANYQREIFKEIWKIHIDRPDIAHEEIQPILNLRDFITYQKR